MATSMLEMNALTVQAYEQLKAGKSTEDVAYFLQDKGLDAPTAYKITDAQAKIVQQQKAQPALTVLVHDAPKPPVAPEPVKQVVAPPQPSAPVAQPKSLVEQFVDGPVQFMQAHGLLTISDWVDYYRERGFPATADMMAALQPARMTATMAASRMNVVFIVPPH